MRSVRCCSLVAPDLSAGKEYTGYRGSAEPRKYKEHGNWGMKNSAYSDSSVQRGNYSHNALPATTTGRRVSGHCFILFCWDCSFLGCTIVTFMASYQNYPSGYALKDLHQMGHDTNNSKEQLVHIDSFSAMNGISRFCEEVFPWRYSKEEEIPLEEFYERNFMYLLNEHSNVNGFKCLFTANGFSGARFQIGFPPIFLVAEPKVFVHGNIRSKDVMSRSWPGCS